MERLEEDSPFKEMPDADTYICSAFLNAGICTSNGMGATPLSWQELESFCKVSVTPLSGWESEQVINMSRAYCKMSKEAEQETCPAPYCGEDSDLALQHQRDLVTRRFEMLAEAKRA